MAPPPYAPPARERVVLSADTDSAFSLPFDCRRPGAELPCPARDETAAERWIRRACQGIMIEQRSGNRREIGNAERWPSGRRHQIANSVRWVLPDQPGSLKAHKTRLFRLWISAQIISIQIVLDTFGHFPARERRRAYRSIACVLTGVGSR
jgi:hypothetical protein